MRYQTISADAAALGIDRIGCRSIALFREMAQGEIEGVSGVISNCR